MSLTHNAAGRQPPKDSPLTVLAVILTPMSGYPMYTRQLGQHGHKLATEKAKTKRAPPTEQKILYSQLRHPPRCVFND